MVYAYIDFVKANGYFDYRRNEQSKYWMYESINEHLRESFYNNPKIAAMLQEKERQVLSGNLTSFVAAKVCWMLTLENKVSIRQVIFSDIHRKAIVPGLRVHLFVLV